ncbi:MAG: hypothetical protein IJY82_02565 [Oscillospiraceae bacterium]|nr:hypothetical protein [Oscillospiraceae bacterium]
MKRKSVFMLALRTFGGCLLSCIMCFIVDISILTIFAEFSPTAGYVIMQIITAILFFSFIYPPLWLEGDRDRNFVSFGRIEPDLYRGFKVGGILSIPFFLLGIMGIVGYFVKDLSAWMTILYCRFLTPQKFGLMGLLIPPLGEKDTSMVISDYPFINILIPVLTPVLIIAVAGGAYLLGYHRISLQEKIIFVNKKKK